MTYPDMLDRVEVIAVMLNAMSNTNDIMSVDRRRLIIERQQLLTKLVAAGIIDNS